MNEVRKKSPESATSPGELVLLEDDPFDLGKERAKFDEIMNVFNDAARASHHAKQQPTALGTKTARMRLLR